MLTLKTEELVLSQIVTLIFVTLKACSSLSYPLHEHITFWKEHNIGIE